VTQKQTTIFVLEYQTFFRLGESEKKCIKKMGREHKLMERTIRGKQEGISGGTSCGGKNNFQIRKQK
jgi:hypothetical protein